MHAHVLQRLHIRYASILDQAHSLKLELPRKLPSLHDTPPAPLKHLTRCLRNRVQATSDLFVGKPGPTSIFECMEAKLPMLLELNQKTLIQERFNAEYVCYHGVGTVFRSSRDLVQILSRILAGELKFRHIPQSMVGAPCQELRREIVQ